MKHRATLRAVAEADGASFVAAARASKHLHGRWVAPPMDEDGFRRSLERYDNNHNFGFVVCLSESGELVGAINLTNVVYGVFQSGYLGYYAFAGHEGKGLMQEGLQHVTRHAFSRLGLHRLEANIQPENLASIALVRSCGFRKEGYSATYLKLNGRWRDHERWALVRGQGNAV